MLGVTEGVTSAQWDAVTCYGRRQTWNPRALVESTLNAMEQLAFEPVSRLAHPTAFFCSRARLFLHVLRFHV